jgi:hypothetical protein
MILRAVSPKGERMKQVARSREAFAGRCGGLCSRVEPQGYSSVCGTRAVSVTSASVMRTVLRFWTDTNSIRPERRGAQ